MNSPTPHANALHVPAAELRRYVAALFEAVDVPGEDAALLAELLVRNDLRGVVSHGTRQTSAYVDHFRSGRLNPRARPEVVAETPVTLTVAGDGGLGYFAAHLAAERVVAKAKALGLAAAGTRDHGHSGAAGPVPPAGGPGKPRRDGAPPPPGPPRARP